MRGANTGPCSYENDAPIKALVRLSQETQQLVADDCQGRRLGTLFPRIPFQYSSRFGFIEERNSHTIWKANVKERPSLLEDHVGHTW